MMKIALNTVAAFDYTLTNAAGDELDASPEGAPLEYLHGARNIIPGLERALEGLAAGDARKVVVAPADGYGEYDKRLLARVPRDRFPDGAAIEPGMKFHAQTQDGLRVMTVRDVTGDDVVLDANHELAGETLHFDVKVASVRAATPEEIEHGHPCRKGVHCCGGHGRGHGHGGGHCDGGHGCD